MKRARFARSPAWTIVALFAVLTSGCQPEAPTSLPPNAKVERVILIVVDTLRADYLGPYGGAHATPHMNGLAERGQVFEHAVSSFHQTSMSMGAMFTGLPASIESGDPTTTLPWDQTAFCGMARFRSDDDAGCVPQALTTMAEDLSAAGFWTAGVSANPLLFKPYGYDQGFDTWVEVGEFSDQDSRRTSKREHAASRAGEYVNAAALEVLRNRESDSFFFYVQYLDVHDWLLLKRSYHGSVEMQDVFVGELLAFLEAEGLLEGAAVILTADHGETRGEPHPQKPLGGHQGNPSYEPVLRVPLIVSPPLFEDTSRIVRGFDLRNMVRDLAGLEPLAVQGQPGELLLTEHQYRTLRRGRYKSMWPRDGGPALLFDLEHDAAELHDIAATRPEIVAEHAARLQTLTRMLSAGDTAAAEPDEDEQNRLRALGYLE